MATLHIQLKDSMLDKVIGLLAQFDRSEVEVIVEDAAFLAQKKHLHEQTARLERGEAKTYSIEEVEAHLDKVISEYEAWCFNEPHDLVNSSFKPQTKWKPQSIKAGSSW